MNGQTYAEILKERLQHYDQGLIHRDSSPDHVMRPTERNRPMLIDFGWVKQTITELQAISSGRTVDNSKVPLQARWAVPRASS